MLLTKFNDNKRDLIKTHLKKGLHLLKKFDIVMAKYPA